MMQEPRATELSCRALEEVGNRAAAAACMCICAAYAVQHMTSCLGVCCAFAQPELVHMLVRSTVKAGPFVSTMLCCAVLATPQIWAASGSVVHPGGMCCAGCCTMWPVEMTECCAAYYPVFLCMKMWVVHRGGSCVYPPRLFCPVIGVAAAATSGRLPCLSCCGVVLH